MSCINALSSLIRAPVADQRRRKLGDSPSGSGGPGRGVGAGYGADGDPLRVMGKRNRSGAGREPHGRRWVVDSNSLILFNSTTWRWVGLKSWTTGLKFANYNKVFSCFVLCAPGIFAGCWLPCPGNGFIRGGKALCRAASRRQSTTPHCSTVPLRSLTAIFSSSSQPAW